MSKEPFVYEGRLRGIDPEPGYELQLLDHPAAEEFYGPNLAGEIERWHDGTLSLFLNQGGPRFRITVEEIGS